MKRPYLFGLVAWGSAVLALFAWVLATNPPHEVTFAFVAVFGGLTMILAYQRGHSNAIRWARDFLPK